MKRIVSVWLSNFPLDRLRRQARTSHPQISATHSGKASPFALVVKDANGIRISAFNRVAQRGGIHEGMRLADARALLPSLIIRPAEPRADALALQALAEWCQRYTPVVSVDGEAGLWLDVTGAAHLCGGENGLLADLDQRLRAIGFENLLGLAETPGAAWAVARFATVRKLQDHIVPPHGVQSALHRLPLEALRLEESCVYLLKRFGLKTIGELCALPRVSLKRRFPSEETGKAVLHRLDQALGRAGEPIVPLRPEPAYYERMSCPEPILETESFRLVLHDLLARLCNRMEKDCKGADALTFSAYHADGGVSRAAIATARPSRDAAHLAHLFRDRIEAINPGFGVDVLVLSADAVERLEAKQLPLSGNPKCIRDNDDLDQLIDRLSNRLGSQNVQRAVPCESHIPERAEKRVSALQAVTPETKKTPGKPLRPFRLLDRPEPIQVMAEVPEGPPMRFTWRRVMHRVVRAEGPERIAPEWWHTARAGRERTRDYYRVEDTDGRRFWLFREGLYRDTGKEPLPAWHMHGFFA